MEGMTTFLESMEYWHWLSFALLLIIVEITLIGAYFLLWVALAAALVGVLVLAMPTLTWPLQLIIFSLASIAGVVWWFYYRKNNPEKPSAEPGLNKRGAQYIDRVFELEAALEANVQGRMKVRDTMWSVKSGVDIKKGKNVRVVGYESNVLLVEPIEEA